MKKPVLLLLFFCLHFMAVGQDKYAVLIIGDYADRGVPEQYRWNNDGTKGHTPHEEFWHDTFLMWKMLQSKGFDRDNIYVLFANGVDYESDNPLYIPPIGDTVTNDSATIRKVTNLFEDLRNGSNGKPCLTEDDFLFVWIFDHGWEEHDHSFIHLLDGMMSDTDFSSLLNVIPTNRKTYWMQQCSGGGFADELQAENVVFNSACQANESAFPADDYTVDSVFFVENDTLNTKSYLHGEFDYHLLSVCNGETPTGQVVYYTDTLANGDLNHDGLVSFYEAYIWEEGHESNERYNGQYFLGETPLYSDLGNIGQHASFEYPTLLFDSIVGNESHRGIIGISKDLYVADGQTLTITGNSTVTLCNNARLVIEEGGSLAINGNIRFYGKNDNIIKINGNFTNNSDTLAFNNLKIQVTSEDFSISKASFYDTELDYNPLPTPPNPSIQESGSITVRSCFFSNPHKQFAIRLKNTASFSIQNNVINTSAGNGVYVANSGNTATDNSAVRRISYNTINHCSSAGLVLYASSGDVLMNQIFRNGTGVKLLNNCNINDFNGNCGAFLAENTQYIHDNDSYEIYLTSNCAPQNMHYNMIADTIGGNTPFIYYDGNVGFGEPPVTSMTVIDVTKNAWGSNFIPSAHLYSTTPNVTYDTLPYWSMGTCFDNGVTEGQRLVASADSLRELGEFAMAKIVYRQVVDNYPHTTSAATALKIMLPLESMTGQDYSSLQRYYLTDPAIMSDTILGKLASSLSNKCDEILGNYSKAIAWYEDVITNPNTTFCDSVFATIDLGDLYLKMEGDGEKTVGKLTQFRPDSRAAFEAQCQYALSLLPLSSNGDAPFFGPLDGPFPYWTDTITEQPEGYVVDAEGNVEISSSDGLVWLISAVNGLNGCEPDDFDGRTVSDDIDFGEVGMNYQFSPIGTRETPFMGTFDGREHEIRNLMMRYNYNYGGVCDSDLGIFGYIRHATVSNVTIDSTCNIGAGCHNTEYNRGCMVGFADSLSLVDNCHLHHYNQYGFEWGGALVGMNRNSTIRNCSFDACHYGMCLGAGIVCINYSTGEYSDAVVENCYFYGWIDDASLNRIYVGGLVCINQTDPNNNGKQAIIRNCHSTPTHRFTSSRYGIFTYKHSEGSLVSNCYTDLTSFGSTNYMVGAEQGGELRDCSRYININGAGTLEYPVTVNDTITNNLLDALNLWIEEQEHPELYRTWTIVTDSIPVFGEYYIGVPENEVDREDIKVYPNPTNGQVTITGENLRKAEVVNMLGQHFLSVMGGGNELKINMQRLPRGVYFVTVTDNEGRKCVKKVVKE